MPDRAGPSRTPARALPAHVTVPLLERVRLAAEDEEYAEVARERASRADRSADPAADGSHGSDGREGSGAGRAATVAALLLFGLLLATAFAQHARVAEEDATSRAALLARIAADREANAETQAAIGRLQAQVSRLQRDEQVLTAEQRRVEGRVERLGALSGFTAVRGPGVRIRVADADDGDPLGVVRDEDLAQLADALWGVGAEAIAINGQRLTALTAIRNSGNAVNVNSRPLSPPYLVSAIGDPDTLQSDLLASPRGNAWIGMADQLGFEWSMQNADSLDLPGARLREPRYAVQGLGSRVEKEVSP